MVNAAGLIGESELAHVFTVYVTVAPACINSGKAQGKVTGHTHGVVIFFIASPNEKQSNHTEALLSGAGSSTAGSGAPSLLTEDSSLRSGWDLLSRMVTLCTHKYSDSV